MEDDGVKAEAMQILDSFQVLPKLMVFDLDFTLWPFCCDVISKREMPSLYPGMKGILFALNDKGIGVAIASRSPTPDIAKMFLNKLGIRSMIVDQEIFFSWGGKTEHFKSIHRKTGIAFTEMLFFDDENQNIEAAANMGVTCILVQNGVTQQAFRQGLMKFSQKSSVSGEEASSANNKSTDFNS